MPPVEGTLVDEALEEIIVALGTFEPLLEGLRDYARLNIKPDTLVVVNAAIQEHERRIDRLLSARTALETLLGDGYPRLDVHDVAAIVYADLKEQFESIQAALNHFRAEEMATSLGLSAGDVEHKP